MRIAQVAPLFESVPPHKYGGTERVVSYLTEELVRAGADVTLFASGDSVTRAELDPICARSLRLDPEVRDLLAPTICQLERVARRAREFDVVHFHIDYLHFPLSRRLGLKQLTTLHGRLDLRELQDLYDEFRDMPVVSISLAQRRPLAQAQFIGNVYHGLPLDLYRFDPEPDDYLAFIGRISPEKRVDRAVAIARRLGMRLRIAAKLDRVERDYYEREIAGLFADPRVEYVGEIGEADKGAFLGKARCLLFPGDWPEPFGLAMIEAMACGTPVVAFRCGSVPEVLDDGVTGYCVDSLDAAVAATARAMALDRRRCRERFERRFSAERMARDYMRLYGALVEDRGGVAA
ncbi:Glycosyltransferase involved in cell wall bisynthesis [Nannocystis exedens]|uniref:Glycosyltransferase involved in cell wall bisynthesis n=1 Tax=Nannocystis exedens TaxID=54 RepID=A0A1I1WK75_9BACT|nr:glycosyltransferase family 4 protein [Nannocystis exedens]PCC67811.1 glycosyl transferase [Nannocystis exedens]SFD95585.1 Glycosyltransferase involved in cell wall bisynthesis [Nannocystis exedens]